MTTFINISHVFQNVNPFTFAYINTGMIQGCGDIDSSEILMGDSSQKEDMALPFLLWK